MSTQTQMQDAFTKAGYHAPERPEDRLRRMMREAITEGGKSADLSTDYFIRALNDADDAELLWELFAPVRGLVIRRLFTDTLVEMSAEAAQRGADGKAAWPVPQGQTRTADPSATNADGEAKRGLLQDPTNGASPSAPNGGTGVRNILPQGHSMAFPAPAARPGPAPQNPSRKALGYAARDTVARLSILRTFRKIGGAPLAEVTGRAARDWLLTHERDSRFVRLISAQVPDEIMIGAMIPEDEADRLYRLATEADNV